MNEKEWEEFWEWLHGELYPDSDEDENIGWWLDEMFQKWKALRPCSKCGKKVILDREKTYIRGYVVSIYEQCPACYEVFNYTDKSNEAIRSAVKKIDSGRITPQEIIYLAEAFELTEKDVNTQRAKEIIKENDATRYDLLDRMKGKIKDENSKIEES